MRPLTYAWSVSPAAACDNHERVSASLAAAGSTAIVTLDATALDGGSVFTITLVVTSFLGLSSMPSTLTLTRAAMPVPSITIQAPPLLILPAAARIALVAQARTAPCFADESNGSSSIRFTWSHIGSSGNLSVAPLLLDTISSSLRDLYLSGGSLASGVLYTLRVLGCMVMDPRVCSSDVTQVLLRSEPLRASIADGDRTVGVLEDLLLDACASHDPAEPLASCAKEKSGRASANCNNSLLSFKWSCARGNFTSPLGTELPAEPDTDSTGSARELGAAAPGSAACGIVAPTSNFCAWRIRAGTLQAGTYSFGVAVSKVDGESAFATVRITAKEGALPAVSIGVWGLNLRKESPSSKLKLLGRAVLPEATTGGGVKREREGKGGEREG